MHWISQAHLIIGSLPENPEVSVFIKSTMLNLKVCKEILNKNKEKYSDQQVEQVSEFVAMLADVWVNHQIKDSENEKNCGYLHQGINGYSG